MGWYDPIKTSHKQYCTIREKEAVKLLRSSIPDIILSRTSLAEEDSIHEEVGDGMEIYGIIKNCNTFVCKIL